MMDHNERVLLVDDDAIMRRTYGRLLTAFGADVTSVGSGMEAFELVRDAIAVGRPFAVAVVDRMMVGWDGFTTIEKLWSADPELQIVLCTSSEVSVADLEARFSTSDELMLIRKPVHGAELLQGVRTMTKKRRMMLRANAKVHDLESIVDARTAELANERHWRDQIQAEMRLAQRLETIGELAAGVAHEINSPLHYVGDHASFLIEASADLAAFIDDVRTIVAAYPEAAAQVAQREEEFDVAYVCGELSSAAAGVKTGIERIATIVRALRELSHPGGSPAKADINRALESALELTTSAYRYHCEVVRDLGELPSITCQIGELGQVFVNLIVNAAHAMESQDRASRGRLGVRSYHDIDSIVIEISDTGCGIPEAIRDRIFEPFFTTKSVGRGTGQGLPIVRTIVEKHGGQVTFESIVGAGTTFRIRLPIGAAAKEVA